MEPEFYDWTASSSGLSNSSAAYIRLVHEVEQLIRQDAHMLIAGHADATARLIMSHLAHKYKLIPSVQTAESLLTTERKKV